MKHVCFLFECHCMWVNNLETRHHEANEFVLSPTYIPYNFHAQFSRPFKEINFAVRLRGGIAELDDVVSLSKSVTEDQTLRGSADCWLLQIGKDVCQTPVYARGIGHFDRRILTTVRLNLGRQG